jgi:hypothetical protein
MKIASLDGNRHNSYSDTFVRPNWWLNKIFYIYTCIDYASGFHFSTFSHPSSCQNQSFIKHLCLSMWMCTCAMWLIWIYLREFNHAENSQLYWGKNEEGKIEGKKKQYTLWLPWINNKKKKFPSPHSTSFDYLQLRLVLKAHLSGKILLSIVINFDQ